jgi:desulfoferrodoxin-like iron-binding protein
MADKAGSKYTCATCGATVIVVKTGEGKLRCHDTPMAAA